MSSLLTSADYWVEMTPQEEKLGMQANLCDARMGLACQTKIHLAIFFDGMGFNVREDNLPISNVGRLYRGFPEAAMGALHRKPIYVPGLGTNMHFNDWRRAKEQADELAKKKFEAARDAPMDTAKGAVTDKAKEQGKEAVEEIGRGRSLRKAAGEAMSDTMKAAPGEIKDAFGKIIRNPYKHGVKAAKDAAADIAVASLEHFNWIRDSKLLAKVIGAGVKPRLSDAMQAFRRHIDEVPTKTKLMEIQVSVYGCDWGGGMARAFLNELCKASVQRDALSTSLQWQLPSGQRVPLKLMFVGLFDSFGYHVDSSTAKGISLAPLLKSEVADAMELPRGVESAVHFIAGHEVFDRVHSIGGAKLQPLTAPMVDAPARVERIFPGTSWEISGAYAPGAQGRNNAIGQVALVDMWRLSRLRGVPFDGLEVTKTYAQDLSRDFDLTAQRDARHCLRNYVATIDKLSREFNELEGARDAIEMMGSGDLAKAMFQHRMLHVAWLSDLVWKHASQDTTWDALPATLRNSLIQGGVDFSRLIIKAGHYHGPEIVGRVHRLTDYEIPCFALYVLTEKKHKANQKWDFGPLLGNVFGQMMHLPFDKPEDPSAYKWLPNNPRLLRERCIDDGSDLREATFKEKMQQFGERYLGFKPREPEPLFDSEEDEANRKRWDAESERFRSAQPQWPKSKRSAPL